MLLSDILILAIGLILLRVLPRKMQRKLFLFFTVLFIFKLQPAVPIRNFDFWFPFLSLSVTILCWQLCSRSKQKGDFTDLLVILGAIASVELTRLLDISNFLTKTRPPQIQLFLIGLLIFLLLLCLARFLRFRNQKIILTSGIVFLIFLLILLKTPSLTLDISRFLRMISGQSAENAAISDVRWLGISYLVFRLLAVLIDTRNGRKFSMPLGDFLIYVCFPPALSAGPIDRYDRFSKDLNAVSGELSGDFMAAFERISVGLFKKFILADSLSIVALSSQNSHLWIHPFWAWCALFFYGLQIYFDFSGYSDIAIGLGRLIGIHLPENFQHPYLKPDISKFWNNWHMTLTQWIRSYVFNPMTRKMRSNKAHPLPPWLIILVTQMTTMLIIGLWHGVTVNFLIWGAWHGFGLFFHQQYYQITKNLITELQEHKRLLYHAYTILSTTVTIFFVMAGWIWFVIPSTGDALQFFSRLF
ncbi:MBOAT family O-acyltransferase [Flexilinea flocculi]|jgi:D-alanyl-lipoteichoic acid acyltransferase DltB (MBOAT superfamily)|uniref:D-alanyl-lipoteichoic acid acyltransferase DltB, MBOAT superfamily n=1 Tax=Flexilinea flocculi TaxID=1678840 RepID=A0A0K8PB85_9CHLR|nr:MBOAT family O-acyltransferase [Flexilinea flocculi]NMB94849.1 MBOAT family protein [Flexilinea flocculi]GAP39906.1 D-alanyl-lipoteichoic acid acyltransferase DltB, MBOAT superfamily [Flexilinea flocculi]